MPRPEVPAICYLGRSCPCSGLSLGVAAGGRHRVSASKLGQWSFVRCSVTGSLKRVGWGQASTHTCAAEKFPIRFSKELYTP